MRDTLGKRLLIASGLLVALVALIFGVMLVAIGDLRGAERSARTSQQIIAASHALQAHVLSIETSARGYVITHEEPFLGPWKRDVAAFPARAAELDRLTAGRPSERAAERRIAASVRAYISEYSAPLIATAPRRSGTRSQHGRRPAKASAASTPSARSSAI